MTNITITDTVTITDIDTKLYTLLDDDMTLFEKTSGVFKVVLQYNPISKVYIVIKYDTIKQKNDVLCITKRLTTVIKTYNNALL